MISERSRARHEHQPGRLDRWLFAFVALSAVSLSLWLLDGMMVPLAVAALLALLLHPARCWLEARGIGRRPASLALACLIALGTLISLGSTIPFLANEGIELWRQLQQLDVGRIERWIGRWLPPAFELDQIGPSGQVLGSAVNTVIVWGQAALGTLTLIVLLPIFLYFLMAEGEQWRKGLLGLVPTRHRSGVDAWLDDLASALRRYMIGQGLVCLSQAIWLGTLLFFLGLDFALVLGVSTGLSALIPVVGNLVMLTVTLGLASVQFEGWVWLLAVPVVFATGQMLETFVLGPMLICREAELHLLAVIVAVLAGGRIAGFAGALLALPTLTALQVTAAHTIQHYKQSRFYRKEPDNGRAEPPIHPE